MFNESYRNMSSATGRISAFAGWSAANAPA
jgi:hypothetical protein